MNLISNTNSVAIRTFFYAVELTRDRFVLIDPRTGHKLIECPTALIYRPQFGSEEIAWALVDWNIQAADSGPIDIVIRAHEPEGLTLTITLRCFDEHIELSSSTSPLPLDSAVAHWNVMAAKTRLGMFHVHHWRNRHGHSATYETYNLTQGERYVDEFDEVLRPEMRDQWTRLTEFTTYSTDWQFTPHPSFFLMQRDSVMLGIGARDLPHGFGLEMRCAGADLHHLRFNYGGSEHGYRVGSGEPATAPRVYFWLDHNGIIWDSVDHYVELLGQDGAVTPRVDREVPHWWMRPQYCTWQDQCFISGEPPLYNWMGEKPAATSPVDIFDEAMLDYLVGQIEREKLPVGSVIIDDGWQKLRGDWVAHPDRFPNLRKQIDRIHAMGMKVLMWLAPLDFWEGAQVLSLPELLCGGGVLSRFGTPLLDYSNPRAQDEYVRPMMRYLFSSEPGCLDADGFKSDFMAEKVQASLPVHDSAWCGEEPFILKTMELFHSEMKSYKPDAMHLGCTAHPFFAHVQDAIRTYDVPSSQEQHADRAVMIRHFSPGRPVSLDLSENRSLADIEQHIDIAYRNNLLYELPRISVHATTGEHPLGPDYFPLLRRKLSAWG
jgi:hypothetical protein